MCLHRVQQCDTHSYWLRSSIYTEIQLLHFAIISCREFSDIASYSTPCSFIVAAAVRLWCDIAYCLCSPVSVAAATAAEYSIYLWLRRAFFDPLPSCSLEMHRSGFRVGRCCPSIMLGSCSSGHCMEMVTQRSSSTLQCSQWCALNAIQIVVRR